MIFISVAHSIGSGAVNKLYNLQEYNCSQVMSKACSDHLTSNGVKNVLFDLGRVDTQSKRKQIKKEQIKLYKPELAIEIHCNSDEDSKINYSSCFTWNGNDSTLELSHDIVNNFRIGMKNKISGGFKSFVVPSPGFDVNRFWYLSDNKCNSVIVEPCFISNNEQAQYLSQESYLNSIGYMVAEAITKWKKNKK